VAYVTSLLRMFALPSMVAEHPRTGVHPRPKIRPPSRYREREIPPFFHYVISLAYATIGGIKSEKSLRIEQKSATVFMRCAISFPMRAV